MLTEQQLTSFPQLLLSELHYHIIATMSAPPAKKARTEAPSYELLYHPGIPGRAEYIRLALEASETPYTDPANTSKEGYSKVTACISPDSFYDDAGNPPHFAPPLLRHGDLLISQTPNILLYLGPRLGLVPDSEEGRLHVNQLALTALDWSNEAHDTHHPVGISKYYEEQKEESLTKSGEFREKRCPKFLAYFERVLKGNREREGGEGLYLTGSKLTYADTTLWQVLDGLHYAFPNQMTHLKESGKYPLVFETFYPGIKELDALKKYLASDRRLPYSLGLYRHYPELDAKE